MPPTIWGGWAEAVRQVSDAFPLQKNARVKVLGAQILVEESLDGRVGMSPVMLPNQSVFRAGVNHDLEGLAQVLQPAHELGAMQE